MSSEPATVSPSDQQLVKEARQGSTAGFEELARRYQVPLLHFLKNRTQTTADAEDLVQDTLVRAYENLHRYRATYRFSTWLFTIAHRISLNARRKRRPTEGLDTIESIADGRAEPEAVAIEKEEQTRLWDLAAQTLSPHEMTALWLYYVEEMSVAQIAKVIERSRMATKTILFRARRSLKPLLGKIELGPIDQNPRRPEPSSAATAMEISNG